jgi:hypothetical protein
MSVKTSDLPRKRLDEYQLLFQRWTDATGSLPE